MKRIWNIKKKSGVSPVIATILMVAITVVLAAVLYVMVMNMSGNQGQSTPQGTLSNPQRTATGFNVNSTFGEFNPTTAVTSIKFIIEDTTGGTTIKSWSFTFSSTVSNTNGTIVSGGSPLTNGITGCQYWDVAGNGIINMGDNFVMGFTPAGTGSSSYKVTMVHVPSGGVIGTMTFTN